MHSQYYKQSTGTSTITTLAFAVLAPILLPVANHNIPEGVAQNINESRSSPFDKYKFTYDSIGSNLNVYPMIAFAEKLLADSQQDDEEIAKLADEGFWEIYENF